MKLWSYRPRPSGGWHWVYERDVTPETAEQWLKVFQADMPNVVFRIQKTKPKD